MTARSTFGQRIRAARPRDKYYNLWDETISGLGLRISPSGQRSFFLRRKLPTGTVRSVTFGSPDRMSVAETRREATPRRSGTARAGAFGTCAPPGMGSARAPASPTRRTKDPSAGRQDRPAQQDTGLGPPGVLRPHDGALRHSKPDP